VTHLHAIRRRRWLGLGGSLVAVLLVGSAAAAAAPAAGRVDRGATVTYAQSVGNPPNYILPLTPGNEYGSGNLAYFQPLLWRPLYWLGNGTQPAINPSLSLGGTPQVSNGGRTITISLKSYRWSDGTPVTSRDVQFFINMARAGKATWGGYAKGAFPDNVVKFVADGPRRFSLTFNAAYSLAWLENDELPAITPMPQQAWDLTSASGPVGNYDLTAAGASQVYRFLSKQSQTLSTYATNPLWKVVDGPFHVDAYNPGTSYISFVPNPSYSGPEKPRIGKLVEMPFTSTSAEFDALRSGAVDYGYLPSADVNQRSYFLAKGDKVAAWPSWGINYVVINFSNPTMKPLFRQLYIRQSLQLLVDQPLMIRDILKGYGEVVDGPMPLQPKGPYLSPLEAKNPYPYNPARAAGLLRQHGWTVVRNGTDTCARPGTSASECGPGIRAGMPLNFTIDYPAGTEIYTQGMETWKSFASEVGITLNVQALPLPTIGTLSVPCTHGPSCTWDMVTWEGWGYGSPYPTGEVTFSPYQTGGYHSAVNDANIIATHRSSNPDAMFRYENYLALNLPVIWWWNTPSQISVINGHLHGVVQNALGSFNPENWYMTK